MAPPLQPGGYPEWVYSGPRPTTFKESPASAALVAQGRILPLNQRLPVADDILVMVPFDEAGVYGGILRVTSTGLDEPDGVGLGFGLGMDAAGLRLISNIFKEFTGSSDGRVFTFKIRKGSRWSDGYPFTMEDVRFALEDLVLNKELMPGLPAVLTSPISGNDMKVTFVDDVTFTVTFDDPNFSFAESSAMNIFSGMHGCPRCFISPSHVQKRYHIKYNATEIPALLTQYNQPDWVRLFTTIRSYSRYTSTPSTAIPTTFDANYIYKGEHFLPWMGGFIMTSVSDNEVKFDRNHYFFGVDPDGNQLPYMDGIHGFKVESQAVSAFRMMNAESDYLKNDLLLNEMPLYLQNMEKGDYSVLKHDSPDGADSTLTVNQEFVQDPEIGALLRTKDFRIALSLAWDRNSTNETAASGLGVPRNMVPHESTPYFPGAQYTTLDIEYDLNKAKQIMANLGYTDKDGDGVSVGVGVTVGVGVSVGVGVRVAVGVSV
ncbi:MAG: hypothetical protein FJ319_08040 [SAR202 cluster bacterium]|nr:hypothetical protein [SAR202 cluster bacterium]